VDTYVIFDIHPPPSKIDQPSSIIQFDVCSLSPGKACAIGKDKQKSVPKVNSREYGCPGELMYMDIAGIRIQATATKKILFVDSYSGCAISRFVKCKSELADLVAQLAASAHN
jgi:hypothetical protein